MWHLDLFSGIGGAALAADAVWENMEHTFVEIDPFCQAILKKHWPNSHIHGDIKTFSEKEYNPVFLLTGGFPCQPFSSAGKRKGKEDNRDLWPEMFRIIREAKPHWIVDENVANFVNMELERTVADLENENYEVQPFIIPAVSLNAPHRRDRVWITAHAKSFGDCGTTGEISKENGRQEWNNISESDYAIDLLDVTYARPQLTGREKKRLGSEWIEREAEKIGTDKGNGFADKNRASTNSQSGRPSSCGQSIGKEPERTQLRSHDGYQNGSQWNESWISVATRLCTLDDGLPNGLARPRGWRNAALKGVGNAWVPQVAIEIFRAIKKVETNKLF